MVHCGISWISRRTSLTLMLHHTDAEREWA